VRAKGARKWKVKRRKGRKAKQGNDKENKDM
jgi:hypothetical protein